VSDLELTELTLADLSAVMSGFDDIELDEFCVVLRETIGADRDYAQRCWSSFKAAPIGYCATRDPIAQGDALVMLALQKATARRVRDALLVGVRRGKAERMSAGGAGSTRVDES
jgi:hypothetical protein